MEKHCLHCNKLIGQNATYCSEAHSKAYRRGKKAGQLPGQRDPDISPDKPNMYGFTLSRTDQLFEDYKPGYYAFEDYEKNEKCNNCQKKFKSRMRLLRQCSPDCMLGVLNSLTV